MGPFLAPIYAPSRDRILDVRRLAPRSVKKHETFGNGVTFVPLYNTFTDDDEHIWHYKIAFDANALMESIYQKFDTVKKVDTVIEVTR